MVDWNPESCSVAAFLRARRLVSTFSGSGSGAGGGGGGGGGGVLTEGDFMDYLRFRLGYLLVVTLNGRVIRRVKSRQILP